MLIGEQVTASRHDRLLFRDLCFRLDAGNALVLTGANGAGKSTLLRMIAGFIKPDKGSFTWHGRDIGLDLENYRQDVVYVGHQDGIKPALTARDNLRFAAPLIARSLLADEQQARIDAALQSMGLLMMADWPARYLSAGQRRRLCLARLALFPESSGLWLLDEPITGLDHFSIERLSALMETNRAHGGIIIAATHIPLPLNRAFNLTLNHERTMCDQPS